MLAAILALAVVLDSPPSLDPASLVEQLGSSRYATRVSAEGELIRLGREALPALRAARQSRDLEIRTRAVALLGRIETALLLKATVINLDFRDVLLGDVVAAIGRKTGSKLVVGTLERPELLSRRITLRSTRPLPFWEAVDALAQASDLHPAPGDRSSPGVPDDALLLLEGPTSGAGPASDEGAFRVQVASLQYQNVVQFGPKASDVRSDREFFLQFVLAAEPRLTITRNGPVRLTTAVDDRGQSLIGPTGPGGFEHSAGYFGLNASPVLRFRVDLEYPDSPAKQIKLLRGVIPVIAAARASEPLVIPLDGSKGRSFQNQDESLTLLDIRPAADNQPTMIRLAIKALGAGSEPALPGPGEPLGYRPDSFQQRVEILDAEGRTMPWFPASSTFNGDETQLLMTVGGRKEAGVPTTLRFHQILKANAEVNFEFHDLPIP